MYSGTCISLFLPRVIQLLLFAKHRVGAIVMSHRPIYRQTAAMHNKFLEIFSKYQISRKFTTLHIDTLIEILYTPLRGKVITSHSRKEIKLDKTNSKIYYNHLTASFPGQPGWAGTRKVKPIWILLEQETVSSSGISWAICKSTPRSRQITTPVPHRSVFYRPDALPAAQPTASKHWRIKQQDIKKLKYSTYLRTVLDLDCRLPAMPGINRGVWVFYNAKQNIH